MFLHILHISLLHGLSNTALYNFQEEVVLKRCWLARYWGLAARYGKG